MPSPLAPPSAPSPLRQALQARRTPGVDALRVFAVLAVMFGHAGLGGWGFGLEVLLVISGFLITRMLLSEHAATGTVDVPRFAWQRTTRLLPLVVIYTLLGAAYLMVRHMEVPWFAAVATIFQLHNYYQALTGAQTHYLSHLWSLSMQEQFYLLWPLLLVWAWRRGAKLEWLILGYIAVCWGVRAAELLVFHASDEYLYRALETRSDNLAWGGLVAVLSTRPRWTAVYDRLQGAAPLLLLLVCACVALMVQHQGDLAYKYLFRFAVQPMLIALALPLLLITASNGTWAARALNARWVVAVGQGSYGMYVTHQILMHGCMNTLLRRHCPPMAAFAVSAVLVAVVGHLSFRHLEMPARQWLQGVQFRALLRRVLSSQHRSAA